MTQEEGHRLYSDFGTEAMYRYYKKKTGNPRRMSRTTFSNICRDINDAIMYCIINEGMEFYMPHMGGIRIKKYKPRLKLKEDGDLDTRKIDVDYKASKQLWIDKPETKGTVIFNFNEHTNGNKYRFWWDKRTAKVKNQQAYYFKATRTHKRKLASAIINTRARLSYYE